MSSETETTTPETKETEGEVLGFSWVTTADKNTHVWKQGIGLSEDSSRIYAYVCYRKPYPEIPAEILDRLTPYTNEEGEEFLYTVVGEYPIERITKIRTKSRPSLTHTRTKERKREIITTKVISESEVANILKEKKVLVYTGAGISVAAGTPDMSNLERNLGIDQREKVDDFTRTLAVNPGGIIKRMQKIQDSFFKGSTPAHIALSEIQRVSNLIIATENLDKLHELAGSDVIKLGQINKRITNEHLSQIEYIITVGLQSDDSGLMHRFKQVNPTGRFIALNIVQPPYLDEDDFYLQGDVQHTLPDILQFFK